MKKIYLLLPVLCCISLTTLAQTTVDDCIKLGNEKEAAEDFKAALTYYQKALELEPQNAEAMYYCGYMKFMMQDYMSAIQTFDNAIAIDSESVELYYARGNARFEMRDYNGALEDYDMVLDLDSTDKETYYNRGITRYNLGDREGACNDLLKATKFGDAMAEETWKEICR